MVLFFTSLKKEFRKIKSYTYHKIRFFCFFFVFM